MKTIGTIMLVCLALAVASCTERIVNQQAAANSKSGDKQDQGSPDAGQSGKGQTYASKAPPRALTESDYAGGGASCSVGEKQYPGFGCRASVPDTTEQYNNLARRLSGAEFIFIAEVSDIVEMNQGVKHLSLSVLENLRGDAAKEKFYAFLGEYDGWYLTGGSPYTVFYGIYKGAVGVIAANVIGKGPEQFVHTFLWIEPDGTVALYPAFGHSSDLQDLDTFKKSYQQPIGAKGADAPCCWGGSNGERVPEGDILPGYTCDDYCKNTLWDQIHMDKPAQ